MLVLGSLYYLVGHFIVPSIAEFQIERLSGGAATVHSGRLKGFSGVSLNGVLIAPDANSLTKAPVLQADRIYVHFHPWKILRGRLEVSSIKLSEFLLTADYDPGLKKWNLGGFSVSDRQPSDKWPIPQVTLEKGALRVRSLIGEHLKTLTTIGIHGTVAEKTGRDEYAFSLETDERFGYGPGKLQGGLKLSGKEPHKKFWLNGNLQMPKAGVLRNAWDLHDIHLDCSFDDASIKLNRLEFFLGKSYALIDGQMSRGEGLDYSVNIDLREFGISEQAQPDTIVYGQLYDYVEPGLTGFLRRFHPSGTSDVNMTINGHLKDLQASQLLGTIHCRDISVRDNLFPYTIENLEGDIVFSGRSLNLSGLKGKHKQSDFLIKGSIHNFGPQARTDMHTRSGNLHLDEDIYRAISDPVRDPNDAKMWYHVCPQGTTEMDNHFQQFPDGRMEQSIRLNLIDVSAMYKFFPYPLENLTGTLVLNSDCIELENITSSYDNGSQIKIDGQILNIKSSEPNYHITCRGDRIPIDDQLIQAMDSPQQAIFKGIDMEAGVNFTVKIFPNQTNRVSPDFIADIELVGSSLMLRDFPLPMRDIGLGAEITRDEVRISRFDAATESGHIHLDNSTLWPRGKDPNRPGFSVNMTLDDFKLNKSFWQVAGPDAENMLGKMRVYGPVDANGLLEINLPEVLCKGNDLTIDFSNNPLEWDSVGLGRIDGRLTVQEANGVFSDFDLTDLPLESLPKDIMSEKAKKFCSAMNPEGFVSIRVSSGSVEMGPRGPLKMDVYSEVAADELMVGRKQPPNRIGGIIEGRLVVDIEDGGWTLTSDYNIDHLKYNNWLVTGLSGSIVHDPETCLLHSNHFQAEFYGGNVTGNLEVDLGKVPDYKLELDYDEVELCRLPPLTETVADYERAKNGTVSGRLALTGVFDDLSEPRGKFKAKIANLEMGRQSLLGKVLTAVQFRRPEEYIFHEIDLGAEILGPKLILNQVRIIGNPLVFDGTGTMNLKDRQIKVELSVWDRIVTDKQSILDMLARGFGSALWKVQIHGVFESPQVDAVYLSVLKHPLDIFKEKEKEDE